VEIPGDVILCSISCLLLAGSSLYFFLIFISTWMSLGHCAFPALSVLTDQRRSSKLGVLTGPAQQGRNGISLHFYGEAGQRAGGRISFDI